MTVRRLKVNSRRNSDSIRKLNTLDWKNWWMDTSSGQKYLHVRYVGEGRETWWRVYCKHTDKPRLGLTDGELYWLVDKEPK